ncbi:MAG: hypothetical protein ACLUW6_02190 [Coriobacteriaceae bacterium]
MRSVTSTEDLLDGAQVGDDVARRADAADAGGDVGHLFEGAAPHHGFEQARRLHHGHLAGDDPTVLDNEADVAVALDAGDGSTEISVAAMGYSSPCAAFIATALNISGRR